MDKNEFAQLLYETSFDSTATTEEAIARISPIRNWIKTNIPKKLFRYRKYSDYSIKALETDEIWGSTILEFNDPYECTPSYDANKLIEYLYQMFSVDALRQAITSIKNGNVPPLLLESLPQNVLDNLIQALNTHSEDMIINKLSYDNLTLLDKIKDDWDLIIHSFFAGIQRAESETHIACFSEHCDSSLMWGHYADSHKGFCLEYNFSAALQDCAMNCHSPSKCNNFMLNLPIAPVTYSNHRLDATSYLPSVIQGHLLSHLQTPINIYFLDVLLLSKCQLLKSSDWTYEQEWRLAYRSSSEKYEPYKCIAKLKPSGVYLGSRMPPAHRTSIYEICQKREIPCYTMLQNYTGYNYTLQTQSYADFLHAINCQS